MARIFDTLPRPATASDRPREPAGVGDRGGVPLIAPSQGLRSLDHGSTGRSSCFCLTTMSRRSATLTSWLLVCAALLSAGCTPDELQVPPILAPPPPAPSPAPIAVEDPACKHFSWPLSPQSALDFLSKTTTFAGEAVSIAGAPPPQMAAFHVLMDQPHAAWWFYQLAQADGAAGKLYALAAFQELDPERVFLLGSELRAQTGTVYTFSGCIFDTQAVASVAEKIEQASLGQTFRASRERTLSKYREIRVTGACM